MPQVLGFDESTTIPSYMANGNGIATNRGATESITLAVLPSNPGDSYEVHCIAPYSLTLELPNAEGVLAPTLSQRLVLSTGASVVVRLVAPGIWGHLATGSVSYL